MSQAKTDPLLLAGKIVAILFQGAMVIGAAALAIASTAILIYRDQLIAEYAADFGNSADVFPVFTLLAVMVIGVAICFAMFMFFGRLRCIINTVSEGDPFQPANADRLSHMGWLLVGVQGLILAAAGLGLQLSQFSDELDDVDVGVDGGLDLAGVILVIILFILARVFRVGASMRDELEGTV